MPLILILLPLLFQIIVGRKAVGGDIKLRFGTVCLISILGQIVLTIAAFNLIVYYLQKNKNPCGMPLVGLIMVSLFFSVILFITILIQNRIKKSYGDEEDEVDEEEDINDKIDFEDYENEDENEEDEIN